MNLQQSRLQFAPAWPHGCWPNEAQLSLLHACLLEDTDAAQQAFHRWTARVPFFFVDGGSHKLLLMLYERLRLWGIAYSDMQRLKGIARYYWVHHQRLTHQLHDVAQAFREAGLEVLLLKGAALNATVYTGGTRLMSDLDVAIRREHADKAMALLLHQGWEPQFRQLDRLMAVTHGCHYRRGDGHLDLHWDFFHGKPLDKETQSLLWNAAETVDVGSTPVRVLCPTDQFLHTCEHGLRSNETPPFRWLADACLIVRQSELDWQRLATLAERFQLIEPVMQTLRYLQAHLNAAIPPAAFAELSARHSTFASRLEFFVTTRRMPGSHPFWRNLPSSLFCYLRAWRANRGLSLAEYLTAVNNFVPPLWDNLRSLVKLQLAATMHWVTARATRWRHRTTAEVVRVEPCGDDDRWQGFCPPEPTRRGIFRWSNTNASVLLPVRDVGTVVVRLAKIRPWHGDLDLNLTLRVNRSVVAPQNVRFDNWDVSFDIEPSMLADFPDQRLELRCTKWEDIPSSDPRDLGVPVHEISFHPKAA